MWLAQEPAVGRRLRRDRRDLRDPRPVSRDRPTRRVRIVVASPPRTIGSTTTNPWPGEPLSLSEPAPHGRPGGGVTLWWPGGPLVPSGHGGRALWTLPRTGSGVGCGFAVGRGVGRVVGRAVGCAVGRALGAAGLGAAVTVGVGVGITATTGPASGDPAGGARDGSIDDSAVDPVGAGVASPDPVGPVAVGLGVAAAGLPVTGRDGAAEEAGLPTATWPSGRLGATIPAVSATVARMRLRSPMATTRRAR